MQEEREKRGPSREYTNEAITVYWEAQYCIHTAACLMGLPGVFDSGRRPWIDISQAAADDIAQVVMRCPTGALHFRRHDDGEQETPPPTQRCSRGRTGRCLLGGRSASSTCRAMLCGRILASRSAVAVSRRTSRSATGRIGRSGSRRSRCEMSGVRALVLRAVLSLEYVRWSRSGCGFASGRGV